MWTWRRNRRWSRKDPPQHTKPFMQSKNGHDSMIRTSDVGQVQYSPFFHNNLPSFIMNLPSGMTRSCVQKFKFQTLWNLLCQRWISMCKPIYCLIVHVSATIHPNSSNTAIQCAVLMPSVSALTVQKLSWATRMKLCSCSACKHNPTLPEWAFWPHPAGVSRGRGAAGSLVVRCNWCDSADSCSYQCCVPEIFSLMTPHMHQETHLSIFKTISIHTVLALEKSCKH